MKYMTYHVFKLISQLKGIEKSDYGLIATILSIVFYLLRGVSAARGVLTHSSSLPAPFLDNIIHYT